ncbi:MAG: peptidoglycan-binding protein [Sphingobium sp.]|nr:peptidoglycan-binding protein [Sphingobium sp.]MCP5398544.1 peptidoglycan-binding protein [Sphingomonas sp.]
MTQPVEYRALTPQQRARVILSTARAETASQLWRAALGTDVLATAPTGWSPPKFTQNAGSGNALAALLAGSLSPAPQPGSSYISGGVAPTGSIDRAKTSALPEIMAGLHPPLEGLGANTRYAGALQAASQRTSIPAGAIAAIIDAEAARLGDGSWNPHSRNPRSSAAGLGQFLSGTWISMARDKGSALHAMARDHGLVSATGDIAPGARSRLLALRYDPAAAIAAVADYARANLELLKSKGIAIGHDPRSVARAAYIGHHLGPGDALRYYRGTLDQERARLLLTAQVGSQRAEHYISKTGNPIISHRNWLDDYIAKRVQPHRYYSNINTMPRNSSAS